MNYNDLNEETKVFLNKAIEIYSVIKNQNIQRNVKLLRDEKEYTFTKLDKKILSLFLAGILVDGDLKNIISDYSNIREDDLFEFIGISKDDIKSIDNYKESFEKDFKSDVSFLIRRGLCTCNKVNYITPCVIIQALQYHNKVSSEVLEYFAEEYNLLQSKMFYCHPFFIILGTYNNNNGSVSSLLSIQDRLDKMNKISEFLIQLDKIENNLDNTPKSDEIKKFKLSIQDRLDKMNKLSEILIQLDKIENNLDNTPKPDEIKKPAETFDNIRNDRIYKYDIQKNENSNNFTVSKPNESKNIDDDVWNILDTIKNKFVGQEEVAENLFYNIVNNQRLAELDELIDGQRSIIFLDGPTGTGKTAITREITEKLDIPFISTSIINYSSTGYSGGDITDVLKALYNKAYGNLEKAERGIVVFDEFDKIAYSRKGKAGLEMKRAVQQQLLDFMGSGKYTIKIGNGIYDTKEIEFDTSNLTFVCIGALTDLRLEKTQAKKTMGFNQQNENEESHQYNITPEDLINIGLEKELVGRFNVYFHTNDYSRESLEKILRESTISPLNGFKKWIESNGKKLEFDDDVYGIIADQAYELNSGARSLQTVMNNIRTPLIKEVLRGTDPIIYLDNEIVSKTNIQMMSRKGRL